ncbi:MAG: response regulator, partial [Cyanobacteria bacterium P01_F01_bin.4]
LTPSPPHPLTLHFAVEDTGPGIQLDEIDQLFDAFVQTEPGRQSQEGTGLGLPISREFVRLMGGDITVRNVSKTASRSGALFTFTIQAQVVEPVGVSSPALARPVIALAPNQPTYRLLVVEDQWTNRQLLVELLTPLGFEVREAENGEVAIALCKTWQPHLIWMDMRMPVMDGYEATRRIKAGEQGSRGAGEQGNSLLTPTLREGQSPTPPHPLTFSPPHPSPFPFPPSPIIIALTASAFEEDRTAILAAGCDDFVRKPLQESVIFDKIAQHLGVQYLYAENDQPFSAQQVSDSMLRADSLSVMPDEWIEQLHRAAVRVDADEIFQLLTQIPAEQAALADVLSDLTHRFCFDEIVDLIQDISP